MNEKLQMTTRARFGAATRAQLNGALLEALAASGRTCETCLEVQTDVSVNPEGGEFVEAASFPARTVQKLDAHFRSHWKDDYERVDLSSR